MKYGAVRKFYPSFLQDLSPFSSPKEKKKIVLML